jgi:hypothetical protein
MGGTHLSIPESVIIDTAERAAVEAVEEYEKISKAHPHRMPEYWVTCRVASALASNGMIVECEKRFADLYY